MSMKVVMVSPYPEIDGKITGGVEGACYVLVKGLLKSFDVDIHIVAPCSKNEPRIEQRDDVTIHWIKGSHLPGFIDYWTFYRFEVNKCLNVIKPDVVHYQGVLGWMFNGRFPAVATLHGVSEKDVLYSAGKFVRLRYFIVKTVENIARKKAKDIIVISRYIVDEIGDSLKGRKWNIENPVTEEFFSVTRKEVNNEILYIGRINKRKNIVNMLSVFKSTLQKLPDAKLIVAGDYDNKNYYDECLEYVKNNNLTDAVDFIGGVNREQVLELLSASACLILISHQETAPIIIEEAMSASVPVIASAICGLPYMIDNGKSGYLVNNNENDDITDKLVELLTDKERNIKMGEVGRNIAKNRFHYDIVAQKSYDAYLKAIETT